MNFIKIKINNIYFQHINDFKINFYLKILFKFIIKTIILKFIFTNNFIIKN